MELSKGCTLRKFSCNYLRSAVSLRGRVAVVDEDGVDLDKVNIGGGTNVLQTVIPVTSTIHDLAWGPCEKYADFLAICCDDCIQLWNATQCPPCLHETIKFGRTVPVVCLVWSSVSVDEMWVASPRGVQSVSITTGAISEILSKPGSGGIVASSHQTLLHGTPSGARAIDCTNSREMVVSTGLKDKLISNVQRTYVPRSISLCPWCVQDLNMPDEVCVFAYESELCLSSPAFSLSCPDTIEISLPASVQSTAPTAGQPLISVIDSVDNPLDASEEGENEKEDSSSVFELDRTRGAFPHVLPGTPIAEALHVQHFNGPLHFNKSPLSTLKTIHNGPNASNTFGSGVIQEKESTGSSGVVCVVSVQRSSTNSPPVFSPLCTFTLDLRDAPELCDVDNQVSVSTPLVRPDVLACTSVSVPSEEMWIAVGSSCSPLVAIYRVYPSGIGNGDWKATRERVISLKEKASASTSGKFRTTLLYEPVVGTLTQEPVHSNEDDRALQSSKSAMMGDPAVDRILDAVNAMRESIEVRLDGLEKRMKRQEELVARLLVDKIGTVLT